MSILTLGIKQALINDSADFPVSVTGAGQDAVLNIQGFGRFPVKELVGPIRGVRGVNGTKHKLVVAPANIGVATFDVGSLVTVAIELESSATVMEFARHAETYGKTKRFTLKMAPNDTAAIFLKKLHDAITAEYDEDGFDLFTSAFDAVTNTITIETREKGLGIRKVSFLDGSAGGDSPLITSFNPTVTRSKSGVNDYDTLKLVRLATPATTEPHSLQGLQQPVKGALYTSLLFKVSTPLDHVSTSAAVDTNPNGSSEFQVFIKEGANAAYIDQILTALLTKTGITAIYYGADGTTKATKAEFLA